MRRIRVAMTVVAALMAFGLVMACASTAAQEKVKKEKAQQSLYRRLGGYDAIAAVTDDFLGKMAKDQHLGRFFVGLSTDSQNKTRQLIVDFICSGTGGPCLYTGRTMKTTHKGLKITDSDWEIGVKHLAGTLDKFKVPKQQKDELLSVVSSLKGDIVEVR
jgi:hemoglobin